MQKNLVRLGEYSFNSKYCLGMGSYGKVFEGTDGSGQRVAIKEIKTRVMAEDMYLKTCIDLEIQLLKKFKHPNIVKLIQTVHAKESIYIITEFCEGGDLQEYCKNNKLSESDVVRVLKDIAAGMKALSQQNIVHRDIKPANILISKGVFKIADFGFARRTTGKQLVRTLVGTPIYMAPQLLEKEECGPKTDVWSFGVMAFQMAHGRLPWSAKNETELLRNIKKIPLRINGCGPVLQRMIQKCLQIEEKDRWGWAQVNQYLAGSFGKEKESLSKAFATHQDKLSESKVVVLRSDRKRSLSGSSDQSQQNAKMFVHSKNRLAEEEYFQKNKSKRSQYQLEKEECLLAVIKALCEQGRQSETAKTLLTFVKLKLQELKFQSSGPFKRELDKLLERTSKIETEFEMKVLNMGLRSRENMELIRGQLFKKAAVLLAAIEVPAVEFKDQKVEKEQLLEYLQIVNDK